MQFDFPISEDQANAMGKPELKRKPYKSSGGPMVYNEQLKREIPEGWGVKELKEECDVFNGFAFKSEWYQESGYAIARTKNFSNYKVQPDDIVYISVEMAEKYFKYNLKKFDFLMVMVGASVGNYAIVYSNALPSLQNQNMWRFISKTKTQIYLNQLLIDLIEYQKSISSGSVRSFFQKDIFKKCLIADSPEGLKKHYQEIVLLYFERINIVQQENQKLAHLRDWLLPMLMNGQVRVSEGAKKEYKNEGEVLMAAEGKEGYGQ